jgi:transitional endoplasmic reticulum ATPase
MTNRDQLREALQQSVDNIPLMMLYAQACLEEWAYEEARVVYERILKKEASHRDASLGLARSLFLEGRLSEAIVRLEDLLRRAPDFAAGHVFLARLHLSENNRAAARESYQRGVGIDMRAIDVPLAEQLGLEASGQEKGHDPNASRRQAVGSGPMGSVTRELPQEGADAWKDDEDEDSPNRFVPVEKPKISFKEVGGMEALKEQIRMKILYPLSHADLFKAYGKSAGGGVLLYGPPGCGKTLISRATAGEIQANFFCVALHEILDMWIGNSEKNLHELFRLARENAPSVLFFDEVDALAADRKDLRASAGRTMINQFLAEMDGGTSDNSGVLILGATNAPWHIDSAFRRPGRFDRTIFVPPPDEGARAGIIEVMAQGKPMGELDAKVLAKKTEGFSGADIKAVFDQATEHALEMAMKEGRLVPLTTKTLIQAAKEVKPSTRAWFESAKNYALYANQGGFYDDVLVHLGLKK